MNAFVKIATRQEAENIRSNMSGMKFNKSALRVGWACGYGPRENFNYSGGYTLFPISKIPEQDKSFIIKAPPRGGGPIEGGTVTEEPNLPLECILSSRGNPIAHREGLPPPPRHILEARSRLGLD
jgi:protein NRD1